MGVWSGSHVHICKLTPLNYFCTLNMIQHSNFIQSLRQESGAVLAQKFWGGEGIVPSAASSPSPFSPFSETEKIRTSFRPTFEIYH